MAIYSITNTFSANTLIQSAQVNANFTEISTAINTTLFSGTSDSLLTTKGGTGLVSYTTGDILYASASNTLSKLGAGTNGQVLTQGASVPSWVTPETVNSASTLSNLGLAVSAAGGDITIALKQADGSTNPAAGSGAVKVGFRSATTTDGSFNVRSITAATSLSLTGAITLGATSGEATTVFVYAVDNSGTITLGVALGVFSESVVQSTSTTTTSNAVLYQASALSNKPIRLLGRFTATNTAGSWDSVASVRLAPLFDQQFTSYAFLSGWSAYGSTNTFNSRFTAGSVIGPDMSYNASATLGDNITINTDGVYSIHFIQNGALDSPEGIAIILNSSSNTAIASVAVANKLIEQYGYAPASSAFGGAVTFVGRLKASDVIRFATQAKTTPANSTNCYVRAYKIGD